jgi:hypothetical protein
MADMSKTLAKSACERKPTTPSVILPLPRPASHQVSPKGHKKLPETKTKQLKLKNFPPAIIEEKSKKRNLIQELGIDLSDEDEPSPPKLKKQLLGFEDEPSPSKSISKVVKPPVECTEKTRSLPQLVEDEVPSPSSKSVENGKATFKSILIEAQVAPGYCTHLYVQGTKKGTVCGKKCRKGRNLCGGHSYKPSVTQQPAKPSDFTKVQELEKKVKNLEELLTKSVNFEKTINRLEVLISNVNKAPADGKSFKTNKSRIQKIRIYKMNKTQTYKLLRYKDGMPVVESRNRLYQVVMPNSMKRPIPNGKWCLVCDPNEVSKMMWKEV